MTHEDGKLVEVSTEEVYSKWKKLEQYFDMFYSIRMNFNEILELSEIDKD